MHYSFSLDLEVNQYSSVLFRPASSFYLILAEFILRTNNPNLSYVNFSTHTDNTGTLRLYMQWEKLEI